MKCQKCGKLLEDNYVACPFCGQKIITKETTEMPFIIGGSFKLGDDNYDSGRYGSGNRFIWDVVNVNYDKDFAELVCRKNIDYRNIDCYKIEKKDFYDSELMKFLNGYFYVKAFTNDEKQAFLDYEYDKRKIGPFTIPDIAYITDNKLLDLRFENSIDLDEKIRKRKIDRKKIGDCIWVIDNSNESFTCIGSDEITFDVDSDNCNLIRPMLKISISKVKEQIPNGKIEYISRENAIKSKVDEINSAISELKFEHQRSYDWAVENIPGDHEFEELTNEEIIKGLVNMGWKSNVVEKVVRKSSDIEE